MNIFVYVDESGVLDKYHNDYFTFGGLILLDKLERDTAQRRYSSVEKDLSKKWQWETGKELKAVRLSNKQKSALFRAMNPYFRFGIVVNQKNVIDQIFDNKKSKQRYLDYVFKIGLKHALKHLIRQGKITPENVNSLHVIMDEHSTATDGRYELQEALEQEFKIGTYNRSYDTFFPPLFPDLKQVELKLIDSRHHCLVRAADITANKLFHIARTHNSSEKIIYCTLP